MATKAAVRTIYRTERKSKRHRRAQTTIPLAVVAGFMPLLGHAIAGFNSAGLMGIGKNICLGLSGYNLDDGQWYRNELKYGLWPILGGFLVHWGANKIGLNRALGRARIPLLRI